MAKYCSNCVGNYKNQARVQRNINAKVSAGKYNTKVHKSRLNHAIYTNYVLFRISLSDGFIQESRQEADF